MQRSGGEKRQSVFGELLWCAGLLAAGGGGGRRWGAGRRRVERTMVQVVIICHASFSVDNEAAQKHFREEK